MLIKHTLFWVGLDNQTENLQDEPCGCSELKAPLRGRLRGSLGASPASIGETPPPFEPDQTNADAGFVSIGKMYFIDWLYVCKLYMLMLSCLFYLCVYVLLLFLVVSVIYVWFEFLKLVTGLFIYVFS